MWATKSSNVTFPVCAAVASPVPRATAVSHTVPLVLRAFHLLVSILASPTFLPQLSQDFTGPSALLFPFQSQVPQPCRKEIISTNDFLGGLLSKGLLTAMRAGKKCLSQRWHCGNRDLPKSQGSEARWSCQSSQENKGARQSDGLEVGT